jgi:hypothetical protein
MISEAAGPKLEIVESNIQSDAIYGLVYFGLHISQRVVV